MISIAELIRITAGARKANNKLQGIDIESEYKLIEQNKSKYPRAIRELIISEHNREKGNANE